MNPPSAEWEKALALWSTMLSDGVTPDALALHTLLRALVGADQWPTALVIFDSVAMSSDADDVLTPSVYSMALTACAAGAQVERGEGYIEQMKAAGMTPTDKCYRQLTTAHAAAGDWQGALGVWKQMVELGMEPDAATNKAVYDACEAAGEAEEAKNVLGREMIAMAVKYKDDADDGGGADRWEEQKS